MNLKRGRAVLTDLHLCGAVHAKNARRNKDAPSRYGRAGGAFPTVRELSGTRIPSLYALSGRGTADGHAGAAVCHHDGVGVAALQSRALENGERLVAAKHRRVYDNTIHGPVAAFSRLYAAHHAQFAVDSFEVGGRFGTPVANRELRLGTVIGADIGHQPEGFAVPDRRVEFARDYGKSVACRPELGGHVALRHDHVGADARPWAQPPPWPCCP